MVFEIKIGQAAELDIFELVEYIAKDSPASAAKWADELHAKIISLRELPLRQGLIPEAETLDRELRSLQHYSHRVIYEVDEEQRMVNIVRVFHEARQPLTRKQLPS